MPYYALALEYEAACGDPAQPLRRTRPFFGIELLAPREALLSIRL